MNADSCRSEQKSQLKLAIHVTILRGFANLTIEPATRFRRENRVSASMDADHRKKLTNEHSQEKQANQTG